MTEMLERVARAIAEARGYDWEFVAELHATGPDRAELRMQAQAAIEAMGGWQSMDTAPRDSTLILLWDDDDGDGPVLGEFRSDDEDVFYHAWYLSQTDIRFYPTRWHAIPEPPESRP